MQDGAEIPAEEAGEWLRENRPEQSELIIRQDRALEPEAHKRLLEILFGPLPQ